MLLREDSERAVTVNGPIADWRASVENKGGLLLHVYDRVPEYLCEVCSYNPIFNKLFSDH